MENEFALSIKQNNRGSFFHTNSELNTKVLISRDSAMNVTKRLSNTNRFSSKNKSNSNSVTRKNSNEYLKNDRLTILDKENHLKSQSKEILEFRKIEILTGEKIGFNFTVS